MEKRVIAVFLAFCLIMGGLCLRLYTATTDTKAASYISSHYKNITLDTLRLPIYGCDGEPLVNRTCENFVVAKPTEAAVSLLYEKLSAKEFDVIATPLLQGNAGYVNVGDKFFEQNTSYVTLKKFVRYGDNPTAVHLVGYVNSDGNGVSGIERCFDSYMKTDISLFAGFLCDVNGDFVSGAEIKTDTFYNNHKGGVYLTVDSVIQSVAQEELRASSIKKGAVLVCDTQTGEIRALASVPEFDPKNVGDFLDDKNSPLTNRALSAYPVGSVFKVVVAACALENGISKNFSYRCQGAVQVDGNTFHCNNSVAHGLLNMEGALAHSCNCYFIELVKRVGSKALLETAGALGFGNSTEIAEDLFSAKGEMPTARELKIPGNLANFSFGQGSFTATPVQIINVFNAIANAGKYTSPYCVDFVKAANGNTVYDFTSKAPVYAMSKETADTLSKMLTAVVSEGTAKNAATDGFLSAGKTATAQTGIYNENGEEQLCTWFGGFFPADKPRYSVVILAEEGTTGGEDCAPVFKAIAERIAQRKDF
ncbi:MAG: penicillin-binding protein 2 [Clostridia bacterium]|nr:penicillin-binding protein 2 [Clostridia bacterium]